jgi:hypothetical protein
MAEMHFSGAVMRSGISYRKANEDIREEMAIMDIYIMVTKVSKEMATTFGRNV